MRAALTLMIAAALLAAAPGVQRTTVRIPVWPEAGASLTTEQLTAEAAGQPAKVVSLQGPSDDLMVLLVLDLVADLNEIDLARQALAQTIGALPRNVYIGILRAQDGMQVLLDPTDDRDAILEAIQSAPVTGTPGLLETIGTVAEVGDGILSKAPVRLAALFITDSNIYSYREDFTNPVINYSDSRDLSRRFSDGLVRQRIAKLDEQLSMSQTPVFVVHLEYDRDALNEAYQNGIMQLVSTTAGGAVFCRSNSEIGTAITETFQKIVGHYGVDLQVPAEAAGNVDIVLKSGNGSLAYRNRVRLGK